MINEQKDNISRHSIEEKNKMKLTGVNR